MQGMDNFCSEKILYEVLYLIFWRYCWQKRSVFLITSMQSSIQTKQNFYLRAMT